MEQLARFAVEVVAQQQPRAVADVLDRMRQIVDQPGGDPAEHRLPFLPLHVLLQFDQPIGHGVERGAEILELVAGRDVDARIHLAGGDRLGGALQREDRRDEAAAEQPADRDHDQQGDGNRHRQLSLQRGRVRVGLAGRLLDEHRPAERLRCATRPTGARARRPA